MKGGFLMVDHFHGTEDWDRFMSGIRQVLPDAQVEDLKDNDEIYHTLYNIDERFQIPGNPETCFPPAEVVPASGRTR